MSTIDMENAERLGRALARRAEMRDAFIGSAFAIWREHHEQPLEDLLNCSAEALWRLAVTPKPSADRFVEQVMQLAHAHSANARELVNLLRWEQSRRAMMGSGGGEGLLKAALDPDAGEAP